MNNIPDPLFAQKDLPSFAVLHSELQAEGDHARTPRRQASVAEFPISKGMTGVSMGMAPGGIRGCTHWHATAAEWAFVDKGRVRTTVLSPGGYQETNDFEPGDVWYFLRPRPHARGAWAAGRCHFMLIFDNGCAIEFGTFHGISDWIGHSSKAAQPSENFGLPESTFDGFRDGVLRPGNAAARRQRPLRSPGRSRGRAPASGGSSPTCPTSITRGAGCGSSTFSSKFPIAKTVTKPSGGWNRGRCRELHWHRRPTSGITSSRAVSVTMFGGQGVTGRRRLRRATSSSRRATATRWRTSATSRAASSSASTPGYTRTSICRSGSPPTHPTCWLRTSTSGGAVREVPAQGRVHRGQDRPGK